MCREIAQSAIDARTVASGMGTFGCKTAVSKEIWMSRWLGCAKSNLKTTSILGSSNCMALRRPTVIAIADNHGCANCAFPQFSGTSSPPRARHSQPLRGCSFRLALLGGPFGTREWPFGTREWPFGTREWPFGIRDGERGQAGASFAFHQSPTAKG